MSTATVTIDPTFRFADADRRLSGSFVEHMGRCVYGGVFELPALVEPAALHIPA